MSFRSLFLKSKASWSDELQVMSPEKSWLVGRNHEAIRTGHIRGVSHVAPRSGAELRPWNHLHAIRCVSHRQHRWDILYRRIGEHHIYRKYLERQPTLARYIYKHPGDSDGEHIRRRIVRVYRLLGGIRQPG